MWIKYNANPLANRIEDCAIRAVAVALDIPWDDAFDLIAQSAKAMGAVMHQNAAFGAVLRQNGFRRYIIPNYCPDCYTIKDFCQDHPMEETEVPTQEKEVAAPTITEAGAPMRKGTQEGATHQAEATLVM